MSPIDHPAPELVVLLDEEGRGIGTAPKSGVHHRSTPLHLAFSAYLFDDRGRLLLTRRALGKPTWPGAWTNTCCGHPAPGESLHDAVRRRVREELGLDVVESHVALPAFRYRAVMADGVVENEMCPVVIVRCADVDALAPDPAEVLETRWVPWPRFRKDVLAGRLDVSPWCVDQVRQLSSHPPTGGDADLALLPASLR